jgi:hypothetical protein
MKNKEINLEVVKKVASGLKELRFEIAFVGGAVLSLYADDIASEEARPTDDIDLTIKLATYADWTRTTTRLAELGFEPDMEEKVICRYTFKGFSVDIMSSKDIGLGPTNKWYEAGMENLQTADLDQDIRINILPVEYFLATKFEAFKSRGGCNYYTSHDFEDIIYIIDNHKEIASSIMKVEGPVKEFLRSEIKLIFESNERDQIISAHLSGYAKNRLPLIVEKMKHIVS